MAQNIYDNEAFFKGYTSLPRQVEGLSKAPEWPALRAYIPDIHGANFLDLGCGFGWVCRWAREEGAASVLGVDVSEKMLAKAKEFSKDDRIAYLKEDLDILTLPPNTYQVVFSSLTFHYLKDIDRLFRQVYETLKPGGIFAFSIEHPTFTAPRNAAFIKDSNGKPIWPLDQYFAEGPRTTNWFADGVVKQHRTLSTYITILLSVGFTISGMNEWKPSAEDLKEHPEWSNETNRPAFLLVKATKPKL